MISIAKSRIRNNQQKYSIKIDFLESDISHLPFSDKKFDVCTISYGIRNVHDPLKVLREIHRVTKVNGRIIILESSFPKSKLLRFLLTIHFTYLVPSLAHLMSLNVPAYSYYFKSVKEFQSGTRFLRLLKLSGWKRVCIYQRLMGAVIIYLGKKG